jgi:hypothetical protein
MVISWRAKHHHHQAPVYDVIADKTPLRVRLAGIFAYQQATVKQQLRCQQGQAPVTDIGFVLMGCK